MCHIKKIITLFLVCIAVQSHSSAFALDDLQVKIDDVKKNLKGRIIAEDVEGNLVLEERDGQWYKIEKANLIDRKTDHEPFVPFTQEEMIPLLEKEFPATFKVLKTKRYLIVYDTSTAYAQWCGTMLERLQTAFLYQWKKKDSNSMNRSSHLWRSFLPTEKTFFLLCTKREVGDIGEQIAAYYNFNTNRIVFSDLTGIEKQFEGANRLSRLQIQAFLARPGASQSISTFVHEATHQIAFNSGMHQRYSSCPLWLSEGVAMFYETPELGSNKGWNASGKVNPVRLHDLIEFMSASPRDAVRKMIASDDPLREPENIHAYYATAWAMVYYLNTRKQKNFIEYVKLIAEKKSFEVDDADVRLKEFESIFGDNWNQFYQDFTKFVYSL